MNSYSGLTIRPALVPLSLTAVLLAACNDRNNPNSAQSDPPPQTATVSTELTADQAIAGGDMMAMGHAEITLNLDDNSVSGTVTVTGIEPITVMLNYAFAGERSQDELIILDEVDATTFELPANAVLTETDVDRFFAGALHIRAATTDFPDGALRGQLVPDGIELLRVPMSGTYQVPRVDTMSTGTAFMTLERSSGGVVLHLNVLGPADTIAAHIHDSLAGTNGDVLIGLTQDPDDSFHWFTEDATLDAAGLAAFDAGGLYVNVHTSAFPAGELRGQIEPTDIEVVFTLMTGMDVVSPTLTTTAVDTTAVAIAATTVDDVAEAVSIHINTMDLDDATDASLRQAPVGQNGPEVVALTQDPDNPAHWLIVDHQLAADEFLALGRRGLYLSVASPMYPEGEIRGQLVPDASTPGAFLVQSVSPANGAELATQPTEVRLTFNRDVFPDSVAAGSIELTRSGGDGMFGDGNEEVVDPVAIGVTNATVSLDLTGVTVPNDVFQVSVSNLTDQDGVVLDGDADGAPGGAFTSTFSVIATAPPAPTLSQIQNQIFTPNCAQSGCHSGPSPAAGQNLTDGQTFSNVVGVPSFQQPTLLRVDPGDPDASYLVRKLEGGPGITGEQMPRFSPVLPMAQIQDVRAWIADGAQDN